MAPNVRTRAPINPRWGGALHQLSGPASSSAGAPAPARRGRIAFPAATILHCLLGLLWTLIVLVLISLRDCFITCNAVTDAERYTDVAVWCIGGLSWMALLGFVLRSRGKERVYVAL